MTTERIINELLNSARADFEIRQEALQTIQEFGRMLDDPGFIKTRIWRLLYAECSSI